MKIAFRIDISDKIGTGHLVRMSALAEAFFALGHSCEFFKGEDEPVDFKGYDVVILDTYQVNDEYISNLKDDSRLLACYDDNALYTYNCDVLINANLHAIELDFKLSGKKPHMLLGGKYALLRREFREASPITVKENNLRVFICFGGSDLRNMTPQVIKALSAVDEIELYVVLGGYTKHDNEVYSLKSENILIYKTPKSMVDIMKSCDIAITAAGSMIYELAALGMPTILIPQAENQFLIAEYMDRMGLMKNVSNWRDVDLKILKQETERLLSDVSRRKLESKRLTETVDKNGAENAARAIIDFAAKLPGK
ncbi:MAG: DUF354 domain-containing protein [Eubacterium sp.]|nr:DUF354 domain-containing protein [Eubacterium sp.]